MFKKSTLAIAALMFTGAAVAQGPGPGPGPQSADLTTTIEVLEACVSGGFGADGAAGAITFTDIYQGDTLPAGQSDEFNFVCGIESSYTINAAGSSARTLTSGTSVTPIAYTLKAGTGPTCDGGAVLGNGLGEGLNGTGSGSGGQAIDICANFTAGQETLDIEPDTYTDTVAITVSF